MKNKNILSKIIAALVVLILAGWYYYVTLPAINIHAPGFWQFVIVVLIICCVITALINMKKPKIKVHMGGNIDFGDMKMDYKSPMSRIILKGLIGITVLVVAIFIIGSILSSPIINASKYQQLLSVETRKFADDIKPVSYDQIPILDKDSASTIGKRVMGTMVDMVSQYEVNELYSQINYQNKPVRVTPLQYGSVIKWITNNQRGIPAYIKIDMTTQQAECIRLEEGMKYITSDHFNRNIYRHLRFAYPTYIFDNISFEVDENGTPFWVCPAKKYNIGLFGGVTIGKVVLCNAVTGEMECFDVEDVPQWVDKVYSADMLIQLYDYSGTLKHGYFNSILSQRDCLVTTDGYNYIALEDDVWVYTGITSVGQDQSNVGFVLMNQRTMETRYYEISGAEEYSAMSSAEGKVQNLGYSATFPLLLNVGGQPTYFMALKDSAGLVKQYAMLNIEQYQTVAIGDSVSSCEKAYLQLLNDNGIDTEESVEIEYDTLEITGNITKIVPAVAGGYSHYYIMLEGSNDIFDVNVSDYINIIKYNVGDSIKLEYEKGEGLNTVRGIK